MVRKELWREILQYMSGLCAFQVEKVQFVLMHFRTFFNVAVGTSTVADACYLLVRSAHWFTKSESGPDKGGPSEVAPVWRSQLPSTEASP